MSTRPFPITPTARPDQLLARVAFAHALAGNSKSGGLARVAERLWPNDTVVKAAVAPASTTTPAWAGALATAAVGDYVSSLGTASAAARVFADALRINLNGVASVTLPRRASPPAATDVAWIEEGAPFAVERLAVTGGAVLTPRKLGAIVVATNELLASSAAEAAFTEMLRESVSFALDASFFSDVAASTSRPAGILNGTAALTPNSLGGDAAQMGDLEKLAAAVADGVDDMVIVTHPRQALSLRARTRGQLDFRVYSTRGVAAGVVIALDPKAVAVGFGTDPQFESSTETVIHLDDSAPEQLSTAGASNAAAAPSRSLFQSDCTAFKARLPMAFAMRSAGAVAWISGASWG